MSDEPEEVEDDVDGDEEDGEPKKKGLNKKLLILIGAPVLLLGLGATAAFLLLGGGGDDEHHAEAGEHGEAGGHGADHTAAEEVVFYELPDLLVNIQNDGSRPTYLKLKLTLEVDSEEIAHAIEPAMPRVMDRFQAFLRELRVEDLNGSAGSYRLRLELLRRVNLAVAPVEVRAVLIEEMLIQ